MKKLIVVDVSNFIFRAFFAIRPLTAPDGTPVNAVYGVLSMLLKLLSQYRPTHILLAKDTAGGSFRNELYDLYKANRSEPPEDLIPQFSLIQELIEKMQLPHALNQKYEADDIIGSAVTQWKDYFDEILIASGDKDLMQFVGGNIKMLDTMKDKTYDEKAVMEKMGVRPNQIIDFLSMVGDTSDNIPGMKGIGAKGAAKLLAEYDTLENCIENSDSFTGKKLTNAFTNHIEDAMLSKKLITIVTDMDLGVSKEETEFRFQPHSELINFLTGLNFNSMVKKLEDIHYNEQQAEQGEAVSNLGPALEHTTVESEEGFKNLISMIEGHTAFSMHSEYNSLEIFEKEIHSLSFCFDGKETFNIFFNGKFDSTHLKTILEKTWERDSVEISSEHWKRDIFYADIHGYELKCQRFDIIQAHFVADPGSNHGLKNIAKSYLEMNLIEADKKIKIITEMEQEEKLAFVGQRANVVYAMTEILKKELKTKELEKVYYEMDDVMIPVLSRMERMGVSIDSAYFKEMEKELQKKLDGIEEKVKTLAGDVEVNLNSPKQVGELLFDKLEYPVIKKTKTGYSTDSEVLEKLDLLNVGPIPKQILEYREVGKLLSTYVKTLPLLVNDKSGKIHSTFNQHVAATGRLASKDPNLQNIPIRTELGKKVRQGFIAGKDKILFGADYSQIELRLLAHLSGDETMVKAFNNDLDIHRQTASEVMGVSLGDVTSEERSKAKAVNFGLMYGQSSFGLANQLKISRGEAKQYITNYFQRFNRVKSYLDSLKEEAEKTGYAETMFGRKRYLPDIKSNNRTIKAMAERVAINSPIQGSAADLIKLAMIDIDKKLREDKMESKLVLQVHDELIFETNKDEIETLRPMVKDLMENIVELKIPLKVDMGEGENWLDIK